MSIKEKRRVSDEEFERQYAELQNATPQAELRAAEAFYDNRSRSLVVRLENGSTITTPISALPEFNQTDPKDIAAVKLRPSGTSLQWERLDQDFTVGGLIATVFGSQVLMRELGRKGGSVSTIAKAAAARENGRRGGRPPKSEKDAKESFFDVLLVDADFLQPEIEVMELAVSGQSQQATADLIRQKESLLKIEQGLSVRKRLSSTVIDSSDTVLEPKIEGIEETQEEVPKYATFAAAA